MIKSPCVMEQCRLRDAYAEDLSLPRQLHGVPDSLRAWWDRVDPKELEKSTVRSGRTELLGHLCRRLEKCSRVLDLGCGCGLLAKEAGRRDIVGVDMSPRMVDSSGRWMDLVLPESFLDVFPPERFDAVVLCNVLEPYPAEIRQVLLNHTLEFLIPGGQVLIAVTLGGVGSCDPGLDLVFPSVSSSVNPTDLEWELQLAGFDLASCEVVEAKTVNALSALPGEAPKLERRQYAVVIGTKPAD